MIYDNQYQYLYFIQDNLFNYNNLLNCELNYI